MNTKPNKNVAPKIRKLAETARELRQTKYALSILMGRQAR